MASRLRVDTALYGTAVLTDRLMGFLLLPLLTGGMSPSDYGAWTQTAVAAGLLVPLVLFASPTVAVRYFSGQALAAARWRFFLQLGAFALLLLAVCVATGFAWPAIWSSIVFGGLEHQSLVPVLLTLLAAEAAIEFSMGWLRTIGRIGVVAAALVLRSVTRYLVVFLLVDGARGALISWLGSYAIVQLALASALLTATAWILRCSPGIAPKVARSLKLGELLAFAGPLTVLALFTSLNSLLDRFVLVRWLGLDGVAIYAAAVSLCTIPAAFYSVLGFTLFPELSRQWHGRRLEDVSKLVTLALRVFLFFCLPAVAMLFVGGSWVLQFLTNEAYQAPLEVFLFLGLAVSAFGIYQILLYVLLLDGRSLQILLLAILATVINLALNYLLASRWGMSGAAAAAAMSNIAMVVVAIHLTRKILPWSFPWPDILGIGTRAALAAMPFAVFAFYAVLSDFFGMIAIMLGAMCYLIFDWIHPASIVRSVLRR
ncbi:lipopolysaccharide biosynthesis protein [Variovorax paradoxus]|uniref:lipopolysaccharide biosynthesis protein n=1 Tax=Variovorax paradoxus TaxID=34073 RepID=UPI0027D77D16|nr:lipopolysaccharide biosynthesis protein [Variovorax paradoxus]